MALHALEGSRGIVARLVLLFENKSAHEEASCDPSDGLIYPYFSTSFSIDKLIFLFVMCLCSDLFPYVLHALFKIKHFQQGEKRIKYASAMLLHKLCASQNLTIIPVPVGYCFQCDHFEGLCMNM